MPPPPPSSYERPGLDKGPDSRRSNLLPANWEKLRLARLKIDSYLCQWPVCGAKANAVDHVIPASQGGGDDMDNLQSLCTPHHNAKTAREAGLAAGLSRRQMAANKYSKPEAHPGQVKGFKFREGSTLPNSPGQDLPRNVRNQRNRALRPSGQRIGPYNPGGLMRRR
jgi:hypothetical protein